MIILKMQRVKEERKEMKKRRTQDGTGRDPGEAPRASERARV